MEKNTNSLSKKAGLPPGTLIHVGKKKTEKVKVTVFSYDENSCEEHEYQEKENITVNNDSSKVCWLNVDGIHDTDLLERIGQQFNLDNLSLEDVLNTDHRPKAEYYDLYLLFTLKMLGIDKTGTKIVSEQISFVLTENSLISFQEQQGDLFDQLRDRIRNAKGRVRNKKADYLLYRMVDTVVDNYFLIVERFSYIIEKLEERVVKEPDDAVLQEIQQVKKQLSKMKHSVFPLREAISSIIKDESDLIEDENNKYLRDLYDHIIYIIESIESQRDIVMGLKDLYMSELSNRMNNIMKVLTVIATIFIPLTFIAGVYGMNFQYMPELHWKWAYPVTWLIMILITVAMLLYFRKKKWL